ncbi:MAG: hypothetical protein DRO87_10630 [Candidatus Thorarchaeota archaeon]|nr:MAG: hypothetical protein DRO87_10630 [Candidatus Thorarchaeota archaeon]RLI57173.1 MAG: hypothetical protein DRP09_04010 [Candidatus Thorarchaeota archaeon]
MLSILGGVLLILSGASGAIGVVDEIQEGIQLLFGLSLTLTFESIMGGLALLTIVAGIVTTIGGVILTTSHVRFGRRVIMLAIAAGVAGLLMGLVQLVWAGNLVMSMTLQLQQSMGWIGAILAVVARIVAEQKPMVDR